MAFECLYNVKGIEIEKAYHILVINHLDYANKICHFSINSYKDKTARDQLKNVFFQSPCIRLKEVDFDEFVSIEALNAENANVIERLYAFLKSIDKSTLDSNDRYNSIPCDFKNDSTDILES